MWAPCWWAPGGGYQGLGPKGDGHQGVAPAGGRGGDRGVGQMAFVPGGCRRWALGERKAGVGPRLLEAPRLVGPRVGWWGPVGWAPAEVEGGTRETPREWAPRWWAPRGLASGGWPQGGGALADGPWGLVLAKIIDTFSSNPR